MERMEFLKTDKSGKKIKCEVIATYHHDDNNKDYIVYTDRTFDENKKLRVYYSLYEKIGNNIRLIEITDTEDKKIGLELIKELINDINS